MINDLMKLAIIACVSIAIYIIYYKWIENRDSFSDVVQNSRIQDINMHTMKGGAGLSSVPMMNVAPGASLAPIGHTVKPVTAYNTGVLSPPAPSNPLSSEMSPNYAPLDCFPKDQLTSEDLLPAPGGWEASNPNVDNNVGSLSGANFLTSGTLYGINTTGSSLRNANTQLRSDPPIPRQNVGPWSQSTIEPDNNRKYLEIGSS